MPIVLHSALAICPTEGVLINLLLAGRGASLCTCWMDLNSETQGKPCLGCDRVWYLIWSSWLVCKAKLGAAHTTPISCACSATKVAIFLHRGQGYAVSSAVAQPVAAEPQGSCAWLSSHRASRCCNCLMLCTRQVCLRLLDPYIQ